MSQDKNLVNQIKYKNNRSTRASQEIPYTALDPLITVNDNVLFSIVDQNNAVNNKMTVLQLYDYIRALLPMPIKDRILYKTWAFSDGNKLTLTEDELNNNQKIIITTENLSSLVGDLELVLPASWDSSQGIHIEVDFRSTLYQSANTDIRFFAIKDDGSTVYYDSFVLIPTLLSASSNLRELGRRCSQVVKFDIIDDKIRNPFGSIGYSTVNNSTTINNGGKAINNNNVAFNYKISPCRQESTLDMSFTSGGVSTILDFKGGATTPGEGIIATINSLSSGYNFYLPFFTFSAKSFGSVDSMIIDLDGTNLNTKINYKALETSVLVELRLKNIVINVIGDLNTYLFSVEGETS